MSKYKVYFYPEKRKDKKTTQLIKKDVPIIYSFRFDGKRITGTTGLKCDLIQWSQKDGKFKSAAANSAAMNKILENIRDELVRIYLEMLADGKHITAEAIKKEFRQKQQMTFLDYFDEFVRSEGNNNAWTTGTRAKFKTLRKHLQEFSKVKPVTMEFRSVGHDWYQHLFNYFVEIGHRNATIKKNFRNVNWFLGWAIKVKKQKVTDYNCFKVKTEQDQSKTGTHLNMVFLKPDEFLTMHEAVLTDDRLTRVKDVFSFMCATGLRYSDYAALRPEKITDDKIILMTVKTSDPIEIPLNEFSRAILAKYDNQLPRISNPRLNEYLKELAAILQFNRPITKTFIKAGATITETKPLHEYISTHAARRTFVSLSIFLNMNTSVLMRFTGHKDFKTMQGYLGIYDGEKRAEMNRMSSAEIIRTLNN
jgi:integrase